MVNWYLSVRNVMRAIEGKARDAIPLYEEGGKEASSAINGYMSSDYEQLWDLWSVVVN